MRDNIARIATLMRRFHEEMPRHVSGAGFMFWVFHVIRDYARTLETGKSRRLPEMPRYLALASALEAAQKPLPIVFGHNDLLPANFLDDGDEALADRFRICRLQDGDVRSGRDRLQCRHVRTRQSVDLLDIYFGGQPDAAMLRALAAMQCASLLREAMWSMVSELHLTAPGADYVAYTGENLARLDAALDAYQHTIRKDSAMTLPTSRRSSSSAAASSAVRRPIIWRATTRPTWCCWSRAQLTSGSTWHAAGLVGQLRSSASITRVLKYSVDLYKGLEAETGLATGWKMTGCLRLATNPGSLDGISGGWRRRRGSFGMEMHLLSPAEVKAMWPLMDVSDLVGASWLPTDGQASPSDITQSLAKGARMHGAKMFEDVRVTGFDMEGGASPRCKTDAGRHRLREGGQLRRAMGAAGRRHGGHHRAAAAGQAPVHHHREDRGPVDRRADDPRSRPAHLFQGRGRRSGDGRLRAESAALGRPATCPTTGSSGCSTTISTISSSIMTQAIERIPALAETGVKQMINGPESFTPDGNFILGTAPECSNMFVGAGFNAFGIASGGGAGWVLAQWAMTARRRSTCGWSISAALPACIATATGCATARWKPMASTIRSAFRMRNTQRAGRASSRRSMSG